MSNINIYLRENLKLIAPKNVFVAPDIDEKRLNNAVKAFGYQGSPNNVIALFDTTIFGSGKDGLLFTGMQVIYHPAFTDPIAINFEDISAVTVVDVVKDEKKGTTEKILAVMLKNGGKQDIKSHDSMSLERLKEILNTVISEFKEFKEEKQLISINEMSELLKVAYLKAIINMASETDKQINEKEYAEILLLMTRLELSSESRLTIRTYIANPEQRNALAGLMQEIDKECPEGQIKSLHISLTKDLINLYYSTGRTSMEDFTFLKNNRHLIKVTNGEIELAIMAIKNDHDMLKDDFTDDQIVSAIKALSAKAAAVGTPLAAVYLSGSVIGMSAAGMTSGLATLGLGGMLGLSSMATGIGVAVLLGVGAYAGMRKLTGADEITRSKRRELMLNEVIKQTQATISYLIQDINFITVKINTLIAGNSAQSSKIAELARLLQQLTGAGQVLTQKSTVHQASSIKIRCAKFLDEGKLTTLTREPTKAELYGFILDFYGEKTFMDKKDDAEKEVVKLVLNDGFNNSQLENLSNAFATIGYFNTADVLKGNAADVAGKAKDKLVGLFS